MTTSWTFTPLLTHGYSPDCWKFHIFPCLGLTDSDRMLLRWQCRLFRDALPPPRCWALFTPYFSSTSSWWPSCRSWSNTYSSVDDLFAHLHHIWENDPSQAPELVLQLASTNDGGTTIVSDHVPCFEIVGRDFKRSYQLREVDCIAERMVREIPCVNIKENKSTYTLMLAIGAVLYGRGKLREAEPLWRRCLKGREAVLGPEDPDTLTVVHNLGTLLSERGQLEEAEVMFRRALDAKERVLGPAHPDTLLTINNLGLLLNKHGQLKEAEVLLRRNLAGEAQISGPNHHDTLNARGNLGMLLMKKGDENGRSMVEQVLASLTALPTFSNDHRWIQKFRSSLGIMEKSQWMLESKKSGAAATHPKKYSGKRK